jgi:hypothetical protein
MQISPKQEMEGPDGKRFAENIFLEGQRPRMQILECKVQIASVASSEIF